jgi:TetR/AcrR family transcriptional regulator, tetracycline repressor protein
VTKSQARLDVAAVVRAALDLLDEQGADAVSLRAIATRLDVRMNTVLWHAKTKARLWELVADAIVARAGTDDLPDDPRDRVLELAHRYRRALLAHRDGAAVVAGTYAAEPATLGFADALVDALLRCGHGEREAVWLCWTVVYLTLGLAQEEQSFPDPGDHRLTRAVTSGAYPALARVLPHFEQAAFDERFAFGLDLVLRR